MEEFKGTPGPWQASNYYEDVVTVVDARGFEIATADHCPVLQNYAEKLGIGHWGDDERAYLELNKDEQAANAHLIAAAPELLEALILAESVIRNMAEPSQSKNFTLEAAREAISKALGK